MSGSTVRLELCDPRWFMSIWNDVHSFTQSFIHPFILQIFFASGNMAAWDTKFTGCWGEKKDTGNEINSWAFWVCKHAVFLVLYGVPLSPPSIPEDSHSAGGGTEVERLTLDDQARDKAKKWNQGLRCQSLLPPPPGSRNDGKQQHFTKWKAHSLRLWKEASGKRL